MIKLPTYLAPSNLVIDPHSDEIYMVKSPRQDDNDIAQRLSRATESTESKQFPWQREDGPWRKAVIINRNPSFETVTKDRALSITERVSRPTKASLIRHMEDSGAESDTGGSHAPPRVPTYTPRYYSRRPPVPSSSARPERPILRTESSRQRSRSSSTNATNARNVRFQSPLPQSASRLSSRSASSFDSYNRNSPSRASETSDASRVTPSRASVASDASHTSKSSVASSQVGRVSSSPSSLSQSRASPVKENRQASPTKQPLSRSSSMRSTDSAGSNRGVSARPPRSADSIASSTRSGASSRQSRKSSKDKENRSPSSSSNNKNMELVLNYFSKLPPVV